MIARRSLVLFAGLFALFTVIGWVLGAANISLLLVQSFAYALIAFINRFRSLGQYVFLEISPL